ncbi:hypothetical protein [Gallaecimonas pentaromativorans]|nr:hypothetical protein [Gallaecimonas pentaromativorans]
MSYITTHHGHQRIKIKGNNDVTSKEMEIAMKKKILLGLMALVSSVVFALPVATVERTYYATPEMKEVVGYFFQGCTFSAHTSWGVKTPYYVVGMEIPCN